MLSEAEDNKLRVKKAKVGQIVGLLVAVGSLAVAALIAYWALFPLTPVLDVKNDPVPVRPPKVANDSAVILNFHYCKTGGETGTVETSFVSRRTVLNLPVGIDRQDAICKQVDLPMLVPPQAGTDTYHVHFKVTYRVNPIRSQVVEFDSQEFQVINSKLP